MYDVGKSPRTPFKSPIHQSSSTSLTTVILSPALKDSSSGLSLVKLCRAFTNFGREIEEPDLTCDDVLDEDKLSFDLCPGIIFMIVERLDVDPDRDSFVGLLFPSSISTAVSPSSSLSSFFLLFPLTDPIQFATLMRRVDLSSVASVTLFLRDDLELGREIDGDDLASEASPTESVRRREGVVGRLIVARLAADGRRLRERAPSSSRTLSSSDDPPESFSWLDFVDRWERTELYLGLGLVLLLLDLLKTWVGTGELPLLVLFLDRMELKKGTDEIQVKKYGAIEHEPILPVGFDVFQNAHILLDKVQLCVEKSPELALLFNLVILNDLHVRMQILLRLVTRSKQQGQIIVHKPR